MLVRSGRHELARTACAILHGHEILSPQHQHDFLAKQHTPLSNDLFEFPRKPLCAYLPGDWQFDEALNWFEYLLCLCHCDTRVTRYEPRQNPPPHFWAPVGRFASKRDFNKASGLLAETRLTPDNSTPEKVAHLVHVGFFESGGGGFGKYPDLKALLDRHVAKVRKEWLNCFCGAPSIPLALPYGNAVHSSQ